MQKMSMSAMEAAPEMAAGQYGTSFWFRIFLTWVDQKFPGSAALIEKAAELIPWSKLLGAVLAAYADWQAGKDFLAILQEALSEWLDITPGPDGPRMSAKAP